MSNIAIKISFPDTTNDGVTARELMIRDRDGAILVRHPYPPNVEGTDEFVFRDDLNLIITLTDVSTVGQRNQVDEIEYDCSQDADDSPMSDEKIWVSSRVEV